MKSCTPLSDQVRKYADRESVRAHMPGHKGTGSFGYEKYDITEIKEDLYLYGDKGAVHESEIIAGKLFGSGRTFYSAEGSTLAVKAMVTAAFLEARSRDSKIQNRGSMDAGSTARDTESRVCSEIQNHDSMNDGCGSLNMSSRRDTDKEKKYKEHDFNESRKLSHDRKKHGHGGRARGCDGENTGRYGVIAARNVHRSFIDVCAALDLDVYFIEPENGIPQDLCESGITADDLENSCIRYKDKNIFAVYVTSPDYLGNILDIRKIAGVCERHGLPLLVDNAHGAYLAFTEPDLHPIHSGAAMTADSAHKTLPVLTGGAYLHVARNFKERYEKYIPRALQMYASTSPSFLISMSLDECNAFLSGDGKSRIMECIDMTGSLKRKLSQAGAVVRASEPMKLVIDVPASTGGQLTGSGMLTLLDEEYNIVCEYADMDFIVMMMTCSNKKKDYADIYDAVYDILKKTGNAKEAENNEIRESNSACNDSVHIRRGNTEAIRVMTIREAYFSDIEYVDVKDCAGRICAQCTVSCPPAVPPVISGEVITEEQAKMLERFGITEIAAVRGKVFT